MKTTLFFLSILIVLVNTSCKDLTSTKLLEKSIEYHDPDNKWNSFNNIFSVTMKSPNQSDRLSQITINLPEEYFQVVATRDSTTRFTMDKGNCEIALNGSTEISVETAKQNNLNCERANLYKNYYTYLYGLPMKLKDSGTHLDKNIEHRTFKGKDYLVLKVTYDENVGVDIWYFYFNPETFGLEVYQFFKTDEAGEQINDSGEYILLTDEHMVNSIKMPKNRAWYYNKDNSYLGTDILN